MKLSEAGLRKIARFEGFMPHAYKPVASEEWFTIGYGHYGPDVKANQTVTREEATRLLKGDVRWAADAVRDLVRVRVDQCEFDALTSFVFNIGAGGFASSSVLRELNKGHRFRAGLAFMLWVRGESGSLPGLVRRRRSERRLFRGKGRKDCGERRKV